MTLYAHAYAYAYGLHREDVAADYAADVVAGVADGSLELDILDHSREFPAWLERYGVR